MMNPEVIVSDASRQADRYKPRLGNVFEIKSYWVEGSQAEGLVGENISPGILKTFQKKEGDRIFNLLLVHPESERFYAPLIRKSSPGPKFFGAPTASSRTLLAWQEGKESDPFFAKLSLNRTIGSVNRTIKNKEVIRSLGHNDILTRVSSSSEGPLKVLPETFGVHWLGHERGGQIIREIPKWLAQPKKIYIPFFALWGEPPPGKDPLLLSLLNKTRRDPVEFVAKDIVQPLTKEWVRLAVEEGVVAEIHGQNTLVAYDPTTSKLFPSYAFRDFGGFNIDQYYRTAHEYPMPASLPVISSLNKDYFLDQHGIATHDSFYTYFVEGMIYPIERRLQEWAHAKKIKLTSTDAANLRQLAKNTLAKELEKYDVTLSNHSPSHVIAAVRNARKVFQSRQGCSGMIRKYAKRVGV